MSHADDGKAVHDCAAATLISPRASLTVSLALCNFAALAWVQAALLERRTFIELAATERPGVA
jgi:hypothetical protein